MARLTPPMPGAISCRTTRLATEQTMGQMNQRTMIYAVGAVVVIILLIVFAST